ncbi:hypothetical protein BT69DRAFT_1214570 [Atractiella rhizophila]|nr:hypothetical protein BT69DRAFT_1214570 [Atractiella rhizophila]
MPSRPSIHLSRRESTSYNAPDPEVSHTQRYGDFTTIDWIQDTLAERERRMREKMRMEELQYDAEEGGLWHKLKEVSWRAVLAGQSWFVFGLVGASIGLLFSILSITTTWLSDLKNGYCKTGWWLNRKFCCWEIEATGIVGGGGAEAGCQDWNSWDWPIGFGLLCYLCFAVLFAFTAAFLVRSFSPYSAGSGISEIKCILAGFVIQGYLGIWVLVIKSLTLPFTIASGLSVGKEGPSVHVAATIGNVVAKRFKRFSRSQAKMREVITAASAAGVAVAFGSPIGGVLFALEEMTVHFPIKTMWRSFFCALVATFTLSALNPFRTGKLVLFEVTYDRSWHFFEIGFFILIGVFGGLYGAFVIKYNMQVVAFRKKHLANHALLEVVILAGITALISYSNKFLRIDMTESLEILFRECEGGGDYDGLCQTWAQWRMVNSLLLATVLRTILVIVSYGCKVPCGIFIPSMAIGASFGRMVGILVKALYRANPQWAMFSACDPDAPCITPGTYAFLGAAAALGGVMRITVSVVVIMFELTGALTYILPTMIVLMVTKAVSDWFGKGGIAEQMIRFNGYPFLDKEDHAFNIPVAHVMKQDLISLPVAGMKLDELEARMAATPYRGFPVVKSREDNTLIGYVVKADLQWAIEKARKSDLLAPDARCLFQSGVHVAEWNEDDLEDDQSAVVDFSEYVNETPLNVSPKQPLEIVMQLFRQMGPRVILVEQYGKLVGLITIKDILKHIDHLESTEADHVSTPNDDLEATLDELVEWLKEVRDGLVRWATAGRADRQPVRLRKDDEEEGDLLFDRRYSELSERNQRPSTSAGSSVELRRL